jgi:hypothetical protein
MIHPRAWGWCELPSFHHRKRETFKPHQGQCQKPLHGRTSSGVARAGKMEVRVSTETAIGIHLFPFESGDGRMHTLKTERERELFVCRKEENRNG